MHYACSAVATNTATRAMHTNVSTQSYYQVSFHAALDYIFNMSGPTINMYSKHEVLMLEIPRSEPIRRILVLEADDIVFIYATVWQFSSLRAQTANGNTTRPCTW